MDDVWPTGQLDRSALRIEPGELARVSGFGAAPHSPFAWPVYALRVRLRQHVLRRALKMHREDLARAEAARDERLAHWVIERREQLEADPTTSTLLDRVRELERLAGERSQALASANADYRSAAEQLEAEVAPARAAYPAAQAVEKQHLHAFIEHEQAHRHLLGQKQRLVMELRSAHQLASQAALAERLPAGQVPAEHAERIAALSRQSETLAGELEERATRLEEARKELEAARRELARSTRALRAIEAQRRLLDQRFQTQLEEGALGFSEVERQRQGALADAARALLARQSLDYSTLEERRAFVQADSAVADAAARVESHLLALDNYAVRVARRGELMLAAIGVVGLLTIVLWRLL
jgi:hypothetical protein